MGVELFRTVQCDAIVSVRHGQDLILRSEASTGRTLCFMAPLIDKLLQDFHNNNHSSTMGYSPPIEAEFQSQRYDYQNRRCILPRVLIVVPTHELAEEHYHRAAALCEHTKIQAGILHGGRQLLESCAANNATDILIACPGRLWGCVDRAEVGLEKLVAIVFDEVLRLVGSEDMSSG